MKPTHHYLLAFLILGIATGGMMYLDYKNLSGLQEAPLQASILGIPMEGTSSLPPELTPSITPFNSASLTPTSAIPETPTPSILPDLFTSNPVTIINSQPSETFFRFVQTDGQTLPVLRYTVELTESWDPEARYFNVYEIKASSEPEARKQEQILLQLAALQANNRYNLKPTSGTEFFLSPFENTPPLQFQAIQIRNSVYGLEYAPKLYDLVIFHLINKLKAL